MGCFLSTAKLGELASAGIATTIEDGVLKGSELNNDGTPYGSQYWWQGFPSDPSTYEPITGNSTVTFACTSDPTVNGVLACAETYGPPEYCDSGGRWPCNYATANLDGQVPELVCPADVTPGNNYNDDDNDTTGMMGDPHIKQWNGSWYDWHGEVSR